MDLLEHQGKALIARHGVAVPKGALWPAVPDHAGRLVLKAQVPAGKRGKGGGIRFVEDAAGLAAAAGEMQGLRLGGHAVEALWIEEALEIDREAYLAVSLDRDRRCLVLLASRHGGMDVEEAPQADLLRLPVDPLLGLRDFHVARATRALGLPAEHEGEAAAAVRRLYAAAVAEDAELIEVNPLAATADGRVVAADAKVILDDNAAFRRAPPEGAGAGGAAGRSPIEAAVAAAGAVGIEVDPEGDVVAVVSGAGLMMATLDLLCEAGLRVRLAVDLGGTVLAGGERLARVFEAVAAARPRTTFLNAYMHTALCDELARMVAQAHAQAPLEGRVVVRLKGRNSETGREILTGRGFETHAELRPAVDSIRSSASAA